MQKAGLPTAAPLTVLPGVLSGSRRFPLTTFFVLAYAWTWLCWWSAVAVPAGKPLWLSRESLATLGQFGPFAAAVAVTFATSGRLGLRGLLSQCLQWRVRPVWLVVSLVLLPVLMLAAILLHATAHGTLATLQFRGAWTTLPAGFLYTLLLGGPLGEEPGWRGFALPRLQARFGAVAGTLWLGLLEGGWHLPLWWLNPTSCPFPLFLANAVLLTFLFTWLFNHTHGSVLLCLLFHASLNTAGVRLPDVPADYAWLACLSVAVLVILVCDRRLGPAGDAHSKVIPDKEELSPQRYPISTCLRALSPSSV